MVDVRERQECVKGSIDGGGDAIFAKCRKGIITDHFVFVGFSSIQALELFEPIEIEQRKTGFFDRAEIPAASFNGQHACWFLCERVQEFEL